MDGLAYRSYDPFYCRACVRRIDIDTDADHALWCEVVGVDGPEGLTNHYVCASVHEAKRLGVTLDGHGSDDSFRCALRDDQAHASGKGTEAFGVEELNRVLRVGCLL